MKCEFCRENYEEFIDFKPEVLKRMTEAEYAVELEKKRNASERYYTAQKLAAHKRTVHNLPSSEFSEQRLTYEDMFRRKKQ